MTADCRGEKNVFAVHAKVGANRAEQREVERCLDTWYEYIYAYSGDYIILPLVQLIGYGSV